MSAYEGELEVADRCRDGRLLTPSGPPARAGQHPQQILEMFAFPDLFLPAARYCPYLIPSVLV